MQKSAIKESLASSELDPVSDWPTNGLPFSDWSVLDLDSASDALAEFYASQGGRWSGLEGPSVRITGVRARRLAYYSRHVLVETAIRRDGGEGVFDFVYGPTGLTVLDHQPTTIQALNERAGITLDGSAMVDYLVFANSLCSSNLGRTRVVRGSGDLEWLPDADASARQQLDDALAGLSPEDVAADALVIKLAYVLDRTLVRGTVHSTSDGSFGFLKVEPVLEDLPLRGETLEGPLRWYSRG